MNFNVNTVHIGNWKYIDYAHDFDDENFIIINYKLRRVFIVTPISCRFASPTNSITINRGQIIKCIRDIITDPNSVNEVINHLNSYKLD